MIDMSKIPFIPSPNFEVGRGASHITHLVIHAMEGFYQGTITEFKNTNSRVSAHYLVSKHGDITQMVLDKNRAWHVCDANPFCLGIENEDMSIVVDPKTERKTIKTCMNDPGWYTPTQLEILAELSANLMNLYHIPISNLIGHNDPMLRQYRNNHPCPGPYFPWSKFKSMVGAQLK